MPDNNLEQYLSIPICREERQYALFLYNIFLHAKNHAESLSDFEKEIINLCLFEKEAKYDSEDTSIDHIFFEVTILRDYFRKERDPIVMENLGKKKFSDDDTNKLVNHLKETKKTLATLPLFNKRLLGFLGLCNTFLELCSKYPELALYNLGATNGKKLKDSQALFKIYEDANSRNDAKTRFHLAGIMMNAKPDILVVFSKNGKQFAKALECKYESDNSKYKDKDEHSTIDQVLIQECIMAFLFGKRFLDHDNSSFPEKYYPYKTDKEKQEKWKNDYQQIFRSCLCADNKPNYDPFFKGIINAGVKRISFKDEETTHATKLIDAVYGKTGINP